MQDLLNSMDVKCLFLITLQIEREVVNSVCYSSQKRHVTKEVTRYNLVLHPYD